MSDDIIHDEIARENAENYSESLELFHRYDIIKIVYALAELAKASQSEATSRLRTLAKDALASKPR